MTSTLLELRHPNDAPPPGLRFLTELISGSVGPCSMFQERAGFFDEHYVRVTVELVSRHDILRRRV